MIYLFPNPFSILAKEGEPAKSYHLHVIFSRRLNVTVHIKTNSGTTWKGLGKGGRCYVGLQRCQALK